MDLMTNYLGITCLDLIISELFLLIIIEDVLSDTYLRHSNTLPMY